MFAEYLQAAMNHAVYQGFEDGMFYGSIPDIPTFQGLWSEGDMLEASEVELAKAVEECILFRISRHLNLPEIDGRRIVVAKVRE